MAESVGRLRWPVRCLANLHSVDDDDRRRHDESRVPHALSTRGQLVLSSVWDYGCDGTPWIRVKDCRWVDR